MQRHLAAHTSFFCIPNLINKILPLQYIDHTLYCTSTHCIVYTSTHCIVYTYVRMYPFIAQPCPSGLICLVPFISVLVLTSYDFSMAVKVRCAHIHIHTHTLVCAYILHVCVCVCVWSSYDNVYSIYVHNNTCISTHRICVYIHM